MLAQEIANLRKEAIAFKAVRTALRSPSDDSTAAKAAFDKVFHTDVLNLLSMEDMWRSRPKPTPLDFDAIRAGVFKLEKNGINGHVNGNGTAPETPVAGPSGSAAVEKLLDGPSGSATSTAKNGLKDQRALTLQDNLEMFVSRYEDLH